MPVNTNVIKKYIEDHESSYEGRYKYLCGYRTGEHDYKCHYYMLDANFRKIDIFVDIACEKEVKAHFTENLNEQEKQHIINDSLKHILHNESYPKLLHYSLYENYIDGEQGFEVFMAPIDYVNVYEYMKYHNGISQKTVDDFYKIFIPALRTLRERRRYDAYLETMNLLLENILYEHEWISPASKYLNTEYQYHLYYIREIIRKVCEHVGEFYKYAKERFLDIVEKLCRNERFTFCIMTDFGALALSESVMVVNDLIVQLKKTFVLYDVNDDHNKDVNLVFSYLYYIFKNDVENYHGVVRNVFRIIMNNMMTLADSNLDLALGNALLKTEGYEVLIDVFHTDFNTFIFTCFPISSFPQEMRPRVKAELIGAIKFFAGRMENEKFRQSSFEQIVNINRLLLDNFGEWYR